MQNYLRLKVHLMFMAASSVTRYFRTNGNATRVTVWDDMHVRQMTWPRPHPARRAITMSSCLVQALPASHGILGTPCPVQVCQYLAIDGAYPRPNSLILLMAVNSDSAMHVHCVIILQVLMASWVINCRSVRSTGLGQHQGKHLCRLCLAKVFAHAQCSG